MNRCSHSYVVLSGASGGIGFCLAKRLIEHYHCRVLGLGRNAARLQQIKEQLGEDFDYRVMDVTDETAWQALSKELVAIDGLIHCAGYLPDFAPVLPADDEVWRQTVDVNFTACKVGTEILLPRLLESERPFIIGVSSIDAVAPLAGTGAYAVSKAANKAYFQLLREEWRGKIQVSIACPGVTDTPLFDRQTNLKGAEKLIHLLATPPQKVANRTLRRASRGKGLIVTGADGHLLSLGMRLCPNITLRLCRWVMLRSKLPLFQDVFWK